MKRNINIQDHIKRIISRLSQHIENHYKVTFKYFTADQWSELAISKQFAVNLAPDAISVSVASIDENIVIPISIHGQLTSVVKLANGTQLSPEQIQNITELIDGVLGGTLAMTQRIEELEESRAAKLNDLNRGFTYASSSENVIQMSRFSYLRKEDPAQVPTKEIFVSDMPIFIHARSHEQIHKIAHQAYSHSNKLACLNLADLTKEKQLSLEMLNDLGPICILIPEISELTELQVNIFTEHLLDRNKSKNDGALLIFGSILSGSQLLKSKKISLNFYRLISELRLNHLEEALSQGQLTVYAESLLRSQKDLHVMTLLSQMGVAAFNVDDLI